jgi:rod shape-determining protein MreC
MRRRPGRGRLLLLVFLALSILVITLDFRQGSNGPLERAKDISAAIVRPIQRGFTAVFRPVGDFFSALGEMSELQSKNDELEQAVEELESQIKRAEALEEENVRLRDLLELDEPWFEVNKVTAEVTGRAPGNYQWAVTIDRGSADGIEVDMPVIDADGLVGKIARVEESFSTVLMLIDPQGAASARVLGCCDAGLVEGNGTNQDLTMRLVGTNSRVAVGSKVVTSSYPEGLFPPGIPIGVVSHVGGDVRQVEQQLEVSPYAEFTSLDVVSVLLEVQEQPAPPSKDDRGDRGGD